MKLVAIAVLSWLAGLVVYVAALEIVFGQRINRADLLAVMFSSGLAAGIASTTVYTPVMFALRRWLGRRQEIATIAFPITGMALGVIPVVLIVGFWSGGNIARSSVVSSEAALFYGMSVAFGGVFGAGFRLAYGAVEEVRSQ